MSSGMRKTTFQKLVMVGGMVFLVLLVAFLLTRYSIRRTIQENLRQAEAGLMDQTAGKLQDYHDNRMQIASSMVYSPTL